MRSLSLYQIAEWIDGALIQGVPADEVNALSIDSRTVKPGDLFIALKGENHDAHRYLPEVIRSGAGALVVSALPSATESYAGGIIRVKDTLKALQDLARHHRKASEDLFVVGVTGSNGKTSTKDFLAAVLSQEGAVNATSGNFNNHIGLPLTILAGEEGDRFGVWEMGMNHPGEIGVLAEIAQANAAVITTIGTAHIEYMHSREAIAAEKASLAESIPSSGYCVMPEADDFYSYVQERVSAEMVPVGIGRGVVRAENLHSDERGRMSFELVSDHASGVRVSLPMRGEHMVMNALLAAAVGLRQGIASEEIAHALSQVTLTGGRLQELQIGGVSFINDSYNANPDSMRAALQILGTAKISGRRIAVLGHMGELGPHEEEEHLRLGERVVESQIDCLITVGEKAALINQGAKELQANHSFSSHEEATQFLRTYSSVGDLVLVKGSRSAAMEQIIEQFR